MAWISGVREFLGAASLEAVISVIVVIMLFVLYRIIRVLVRIENSQASIEKKFSEKTAQDVAILKEIRTENDDLKRSVQGLHKAMYMVLCGMVDDLHVNGKVKKYRDFIAQRGNWTNED